MLWNLTPFLKASWPKLSQGTLAACSLKRPRHSCREHSSRSSFPCLCWWSWGQNDILLWCHRQSWARRRQTLGGPGPTRMLHRSMLQNKPTTIANKLRFEQIKSSWWYLLHKISICKVVKAPCLEISLGIHECALQLVSEVTQDRICRGVCCWIFLCFCVTSCFVALSFFYLFGSPFQHKTSTNSSWFFKTIVLLLASSLHPDHPPLCLHLPHPSLLSWLDIPTIFWDLVWPSKCKVYQSMNTKFSQATWESSANLVPCLAKAQKQRKSLGRHAGIVGLVPQWRGSSFQALHLQQHSSPTAWCARCQGDGCQSRKRWVSPGARVHSLQRRSKLLHQLQLLLWR